MTAPDEDRVSRIAKALLGMADRANTARGASWEHGARSAGTLTDAVALIGELRAEVERVHAALRSVEWSSVARIDGAMVLACPACRRHVGEGHAVYCPIREALAAARRRDPTAELARLRRQVERLTRERDEALSGEHAAIMRAESAEIGCEIAYRREPTQAEGDAYEAGAPAHLDGECFVAMGSWTGRRCRSCGRWAWGGPTACMECVRKGERDAALADAAKLREALRGLLLSLDASWVGGHDWPDALSAALAALGLDAEQGPPVCPGCHAVAPERCLPGCIDAEIAEDHRHAVESGDYDTGPDSVDGVEQEP